MRKAYRKYGICKKGTENILTKRHKRKGYRETDKIHCKHGHTYVHVYFEWICMSEFYTLHIMFMYLNEAQDRQSRLDAESDHGAYNSHYTQEVECLLLQSVVVEECSSAQEHQPNEQRGLDGDIFCMR